MIDNFFSGKIAIVTGGTRGIGKAISRALLSIGCNVAISYSHDEQSAESARLDFKKSGIAERNYFIMKSDVSKSDDIRELVAYSMEKWGGRISFLVNNAGVLKQGDFFELTEEQWDYTLATNLKGPFLLCQEIMPLMAKLQKPAIVNIVSIGGQTGGSKAPDYAASKAALICFTQSMARIGAPLGIRVNAVSPGWIKTGIFSKETALEMAKEAESKILMKRMGKPEEVADAVVFLLSNKASYITGHVLNVNGGMHF